MRTRIRNVNRTRLLLERLVGGVGGRAAVREPLCEGMRDRCLSPRTDRKSCPAGKQSHICPSGETRDQKTTARRTMALSRTLSFEMLTSGRLWYGIGQMCFHNPGGFVCTGIVQNLQLCDHELRFARPFYTTPNRNSLSNPPQTVYTLPPPPSPLSPPPPPPSSYPHSKQHTPQSATRIAQSRFHGLEAAPPSLRAY